MAFRIDDNGQISVSNASALTSAGTRYTLTIEVEDVGGLIGSNTIIINVEDDDIFMDEYE